MRPPCATGIKKDNLEKLISVERLFARKIVSGWSRMSGLKAIALANIDPIEVVLQQRTACYRLRRFGSFEDLKFTLRRLKWFESDNCSLKKRDSELSSLKRNLLAKFKEKSRIAVLSDKDFGHFHTDSVC